MGEKFYFGKHYGKYPKGVESSYLCWCLNTVRDLDPHLRRAIEAELHHRDDCYRSDEAEPTRPAAARSPAVQFGPVLRQCYGEFARQVHPDRGGTHEEMQLLNGVFTRLRELCEVT